MNQEDKEIKKLFGKRIKELREKENFTQEKMAEKIGIGQRNLSKIECGNNFVTAETLSKILKALNVEAAELFDFKHNDDEEALKVELIEAIKQGKTDVRLMYRFYKSIK